MLSRASLLRRRTLRCDRGTSRKRMLAVRLVSMSQRRLRTGSPAHSLLSSWRWLRIRHIKGTELVSQSGPNRIGVESEARVRADAHSIVVQVGCTQ